MYRLKCVTFYDKVKLSLAFLKNYCARSLKHINYVHSYYMILTLLSFLFANGMGVVTPVSKFSRPQSVPLPWKHWIRLSPLGTERES